MLEAYIYGGLRTPFGRHSGALARVRPDDLLAGVIKEVVARTGFAVESIDDVSVGCASQAGEDSRNIARHALLLAGLPTDTPGAVHNRLCGSGLNALVGAAHAITCGEADVCITGGVESMTRAPFVVGKAPIRRSQEFHRVRLVARRALPQPKIRAGSAPDTMPETADTLARDHHSARGIRLLRLGSQRNMPTLPRRFFQRRSIRSPSLRDGTNRISPDHDEIEPGDDGHAAQIKRFSQATRRNGLGCQRRCGCHVVASRDAG